MKYDVLNACYMIYFIQNEYRIFKTKYSYEKRDLLSKKHGFKMNFKLLLLQLLSCL